MAGGNRRWADALVYVAVRVAVCVIQTVRIETCVPAVRVTAWLLYHVFRIRRRVIDENLEKTFGNWSDRQRRLVALKMWEHLLLMVCEVAHAPRKLHIFNFDRHIEFRDLPKMMRYLLDDRPVILVTGHFGNFELAGFASGLFGFPMFAIARKLDNPFLDQWIKQFRESGGQFLLDKNGCARQVSTLLEHGATLGLLGDQHAGDRGLWVDFLGRPASSHKAVAMFTLTSGAPQLVIYMRRTGKPMEFEMGITDVADPAVGGPHLENAKSLTQWYNSQLGQVVMDWPDQYWWVHRRWRDRPVRKRAQPRETSKAA